VLFPSRLAPPQVLVQFPLVVEALGTLLALEATIVISLVTDPLGLAGSGIDRLG